ncbi:MAG: glycoside hydrolase family 15 protein [Lewinellaceae bacterium]|nr:glycoside hydrolase family 15 protein [Saprospiraceae bacterium]MCB9339303.1 glycoside hydrolase family 15 protein [Lewinellaceae bacterium]
MAQQKYNYGIIGNCAYSALVDRQANIGWLCWPRFDSSFVFGTLLDDEKGGQFSVQPEWDTYTTSQAYIPNTNVLETIFECEDGKYKVIDFAPRFVHYERFFKPLLLVRKVVPLDGRPRIRVSCKPVGNYGEITPTTDFGSNHIRYQGLEAQLRLTTNIPLTYVMEEQAFVLSETKYLVLAWGEPLEGPLESSVESYLDQTVSYWQRWVRNTALEQFQQSTVIRSALTIKLQAFQDTGAIIAAPTTSLTEFPGSTRNWDFRYCWLRNAYYNLKALHDLGHFGIMKDYVGFVENIVLSEDRRLRPLYPIGMNGEPAEKILPLKGYMGERPVRVGNQAYNHIQNDVYGQVLVTLLPFFTDVRLMSQDNQTLIDNVKHCLEMIKATMEEPDNGVWEFRGIIQLHCYTFLFHWVGSMAAQKIARQIGDARMEKYAAELTARAAGMIERCYDEKRGVYTQAIGSAHVDASLLQLINLGYLKPGSKKAKQHLQVLEEHLRAENGLFYRYRHDDDFGQPKTTYLLCAFWYVEVLARMGRVPEAIQNFNSLLNFGNHLGLFSQDVDAETGSQWGNFPQTFSHVSLINAAFAIARKLDSPIFL